jgi:hypothetical protein
VDGEGALEQELGLVTPACGAIDEREIFRDRGDLRVLRPERLLADGQRAWFSTAT